MPDSHVLHITFWINWVLALLAGLLNAVKDNFGLYNPPSAAPVAFDATRGGRWGETVPTPLIGAAAVNLPNGKILIWSAYERFEFSQPDLGDRGRTRTALMDPLTSSIVEELVVNTNHDMFCPGTAYLPDGRVMITGGTSTPRVTFYDPFADTWTRGNDMILGRGYHSMTLMGDGSVFTLGGSFTGGIGNKHGEIWRPESETWTYLPDVKSDGTFIADDVYGVQSGDNHMWFFTAPNTNKLFHAGPSRTAHWIDVTGSGGVRQETVKRSMDQQCGNAVMYDIGKILVLGGSRSQELTDAYREAYVYDINYGENAVLESVGSMQHPRIYSNAVVLPTGDVVVAGGQTKGRKFTDTGAVLQPELWSPETKKFTPLAPMAVPRTYHSTCILMKDARMVCMGGGLCVDWYPTTCYNNPNFEIFTPPYLLNADGSLATRPTILTATSSVALGETISVQTDSPCSKFAIVRLSIVTHTINNDLRRIPLTIDTEVAAIDTYEYTLRVPSNPNVALPGYYWLYAMNSDGVPSEGATVSIMAA